MFAGDNLRGRVVRSMRWWGMPSNHPVQNCWNFELSNSLVSRNFELSRPWVARNNVSREFSLPCHNIAGGGHATAPGPLEVIAAKPACDIHRLTHDVQSLNPFGHHGF